VCRSRRSSAGLKELRGGFFFEIQAGLVDQANRVFGGGVTGADSDGIRSLVAECNLHTVDQVDSGVAGRSAAEDCNQRIGDKAHMHQVVLDGFGQVESYQDRAFTDFELAKNSHLPSGSEGPAEKQNPQITTGLVGLQYTTISV
jgi:hypothetical protein